MSPSEAAAAALRALAGEIRDDLDAIDRLAARLGEIKPRLCTSPDPAAPDVMAAAGYLHHLYTAAESIHERIAARIDGVRPTGDRWHHDLLSCVAAEVPHVRPAVIGPENHRRLVRLLRFRHFFRHAYRIDLLAAELRSVLDDAEGLVPGYRTDLEAFCRHIEEAARTLA